MHATARDGNRRERPAHACGMKIEYCRPDQGHAVTTIIDLMNMI